jgi:glutaredoxin
VLHYYAKADCPLCEKSRPIAADLARRFGYELESVDIESDPALGRRYGETIPVLELDGAVLAWGRFSERALTRKFAALAAPE